MTEEPTEDDGESYICGAETDNTDDPCQFPVDSPDGRCHNHPKDGSGPPEGQGSGDPGHTMGDGDGLIQERIDDIDKPTMRHGLYAVQSDPHGTLEWLAENEPSSFDWVYSKWQSYLSKADFGENTAESDDVLHACLMMHAVRAGRHIQITEGLVEEIPLTDDEGNVVKDPDTGENLMTTKERAANLPVNRIAREARSLLKDHGVLDDPESAKADAMGGWGDAAKRVAQKRDAKTVESRPVDDGDGGGE